jgi:hypothetical protein
MLRSSRRRLASLGLALAATRAIGSSDAATATSLLPSGATTLDELKKRLAATPRRRDFKTVPMILDNASLWDAEALDAVLHYAGAPKQSRDNTELHSDKQDGYVLPHSEMFPSRRALPHQNAPGASSLGSRCRSHRPCCLTCCCREDHLVRRLAPPYLYPALQCPQLAVRISPRLLALQPLQQLPARYVPLVLLVVSGTIYSVFSSMSLGGCIRYDTTTPD